jgi:hypothetical protein
LLSLLPPAGGYNRVIPSGLNDVVFALMFDESMASRVIVIESNCHRKFICFAPNSSSTDYSFLRRDIRRLLPLPPGGG